VIHHAVFLPRALGRRTAKRYARLVQSAAAIAEIFRAERARVLATVIRSCNGDFELAEEAVQMLLHKPRQAATAYKRALALVGSEPERRFLERRLAALG
jgi:predicted RNA polymerase sigma factor